jgi:RNA polymerase sigma factor (TIGR02999 family)
MEPPSGDITAMLVQIRRGNRGAEAELVPLVYQELRRLAAHYMRSERSPHTLQATALVHEAYIRLVGDAGIEWQNRAHFFGVAAQVMRRILVDHARQRDAAKRGGPGVRKISLDHALVVADEATWQILELDQALDRLAAWDHRQCRIVELRFFAGMNVEETAEALSISPTTVKREWSLAKAWLYGELKRATDDNPAMGPD